MQTRRIGEMGGQLAEPTCSSCRATSSEANTLVVSDARRCGCARLRCAGVRAARGPRPHRRPLDHCSPRVGEGG